MSSSSSDSLSPPRLPCVFLKRRLLAAPGSLRFPGISAKLVRKFEITGNFHRCKIFLRFFANFCKRVVWYGGNAGTAECRKPRGSALRTAMTSPVPGYLPCRGRQEWPSCRAVWEGFHETAVSRCCSIRRCAVRGAAFASAKRLHARSGVIRSGGARDDKDAQD